MLTNILLIAKIDFAGNVSSLSFRLTEDFCMTIKDIARISGVAVSTVSRVINNHPDVSAESREKVLAVIREYNFIPNNSARDLVRTKSDAVGLIVRGSQNTFFVDIIHSIESALDEAGYTMVMRQIGSNDNEVTCAASMERDKRLLGIIFLGGRSDYSPEELAVLSVPYVFCTFTNSYGTLSSSDYSSVSILDEEEAAKAVEELISRGHRRIAALISARDDHSISQLRYLGYAKALKAHKIPLDDSLIIPCGTFNMKDAYEAMKSKLEEGVDFTAVFAIADNMAIGAMRALREAGRSVPEDCSLISIDGIEVSEYIEPMLSTLSQPMAEMGRKSVEQLAELIEGKGSHSQIIVKTSLREGASMRTVSATKKARS